MGVPEQGQADGAEQQAGEPAVPARTDHEQGGTLGGLPQRGRGRTAAMVVSISTAGYFSAHGATASATSSRPATRSSGRSDTAVRPWTAWIAWTHMSCRAA